MQTGEEVMDGSCGSTILDADNKVVGVFPYISRDSEDRFAVSATKSRECGHEICGGVQ